MNYNLVIKSWLATLLAPGLPAVTLDESWLSFLICEMGGNSSHR